MAVKRLATLSTYKYDHDKAWFSVLTSWLVENTKSQIGQHKELFVNYVQNQVYALLLIACLLTVLMYYYYYYYLTARNVITSVNESVLPKNTNFAAPSVD